MLVLKSGLKECHMYIPVRNRTAMESQTARKNLFKIFWAKFFLASSGDRSFRTGCRNRRLNTIPPIQTIAKNICRKSKDLYIPSPPFWL